MMRRAEVEKVIRARHGGMIPDPEDTDDREICLGYIKAAAFSLSGQDMPNWCLKWAPWAREAEIRDIVSQASRRRRMMTADGVAGLILVTMAERTRLCLKTIGACDVSKAERMKLAKERKRKRDRSRQEKQRRAEGRKDRQSYVAQGLSATKPWEATGVCRRTWERHRGVAGASRVLLREQKGDTLATSDIQAPPIPPHVHGHAAARAARGGRGLGG
jgi:hypothetical protein